MTRRRHVLAAGTGVCLCLLLLLSASCQSGDEASQERQSFHVNLPRVRVAFNEQGEPRVWGIPLGAFRGLAPAVVDGLKLAPEQVQMLMSWGVQHAEIALAHDGVFLFVNNEPLPHVAWDRAALEEVGGLVDKVGVLPQQVYKVTTASELVPGLLQGLGIGAIVQFPLALDQEEIPFERHPDGMPMADIPDVEQGILDLQIPMAYDPTGEPSIAGIPLSWIERLAGQSLPAGRLTESTMGTLSEAEIQSLLVRMEDQGLVPYINGQRVPYLSWTDEQLTNLVDLIEATDLDDLLEGSDQIMDALRSAVPGVREANLQLSAEFPRQP